jgi:hypothetical protein
MGIEPAAPGFGEISIKPQPGDLKWAKMKLPSIRGDILVGLNQDPGKFFDLDITIPANTTAKVYLPKIPGNYILTVDGKIVENAATEGPWVVVNSASGEHSFKIKKN